MSFHSPHLLWLLVPLALLFIWEFVRHTSRAAATWPKIARAWAGAFDVSLGARHTTADSRPRIWLWLGLMLCVIALARPQWGVLEEKTFDQSREVIIAVDLSRSMLAQDVKPSRLDRSKLLIQSLLDNLKGERVGLVLFAGTAFLQSPLSSDYEVLREFLPVISPDYLPEGGSNYRAMLEASMQAFGTSTADRYLIILSDGESTDDNWKELTGSLKTKGVRVIGLGVGTAQGSFIPDGSGGLVKDDRGAVVLSRLNSSTLQDLAQATGGAYTDASAWVDLAGLLNKTVDAGRKGDFTEKSTARLSERFQWFLAPGLLFLLFSFWAEFPVRPRERALPLAGSRGQRTDNRVPKAAPVVASVLILFSVLCHPSSVRAAEEATPGDTLAAPLSKTIARLAEKPELTAKDCSEMAETTVTYGQRVKSAKQQPPESVIRDALQAVNLGEKSDAKAADWPKLRHDLEELLKREEKKQDDKKDEDKKKDQQQKDQDQKQGPKNQDQSQPDQQKKNEGQNQDQQQQNQNKKQSAFGDMKEQDKRNDQKPPSPKPGTQKVGGQQDKQPTEQVDPELAMPLQKLDQVRNQDSPAKLQQLMQGPQQKTKPTDKDW